MDPVHKRGSIDPVHILMDLVHGPGPPRGSKDQGSMFSTFPSVVHMHSVLDKADCYMQETWNKEASSRQVAIA